MSRTTTLARSAVRRPGVLARLRNPQPVQLVQVSFTGAPAAVVDLARALAQVAVVTSMRHRVDGDEVIQMEAVCYRPGGSRGGAR